MLRIALAQLNLLVGDVPGNARRVIETINAARDAGAQLVVFQELAVCGYPPEDLLFHAGLREQVGQALAEIRAATDGITAVVGYPEYDGELIYNSAGIFADGVDVGCYRKQRLPNYAVFDEQRYFTPGHDALVIEVAGARVGVTICEDVWEQEPCRLAAAAGAQIIVSINGSPFRAGKQALSNFGVAGPYTETLLMASISSRFPGQKLEWDSENVRFTNSDEANRLVKPTCRKGWELPELKDV